ncbi:MAG: hypothetical protein QXT42_06770 [Thermoplasmata archaeon]
MFILDTALVNMVVDVPRAKVRPRRPEFAESAKAFQKVIDYFIERDRIDEKMALVTQSALVFGLSIVKTHWLVEEKEVVVQGERRRSVVYDGPSVEPWDVYEAWWDPNARSVDDAGYFALRSWLSARQLIADACSVPEEHDVTQCDGIYHNVGKLLEMGPYGSTKRQRAQDRYLKRQPRARENLYCVVEYWLDDGLIVLGNDQVVLRHSPNPYWHGQKPIACASTRPDLAEIQGIPETELVDHIQEVLWANHNLRFQNLLLTVERMFTYRETSPFDPRSVRIGPRAFIPVTDHDDIQPVPVQPLPPEAYREEQELLQRMQLVTGITPFVSGAAPLPGISDQTTATGVSILSDVASRLIRFKAEQVNRRIWKRVFEQWGNLIQQFLDRQLWVRVVGEDGNETFQAIGPEEVAGDYDFVLEPTTAIVSKQQDRQEIIALLNVLAPFAQAGIINPSELVMRIARAFDIDDPSKLVQQPPGQPSAAAPQVSPSGPQPESAPPGAQSQPELDPRVLQLFASMLGRRG